MIERVPCDTWRLWRRSIIGANGSGLYQTIAISRDLSGTWTHLDASIFIGRSHPFPILRSGSTTWTHGDRAISIRQPRQPAIVLSPWRGVERLGPFDLHRMGDAISIGWMTVESKTDRDVIAVRSRRDRGPIVT